MAKSIAKKKQESFMKTFVSSVSDTGYYQDVLGKSFWFSFWYLFFLELIASLVVAVLLVITLAVFSPKVPTFVNQAKSGLQTLYPAQLQLAIQSGSVTTNVKQPFFVELPAAWVQIFEHDKMNYKHLLTIDTTTSVDHYADYQTVFLLTKNSFVYPDNDKRESYRVQPLDQLKDRIVINKAIYDDYLTKALPFLDYLPTIFKSFMVLALVLVPLLGAVFGTIFQLIYLLFATLIVWFIATIMKKKLNYGQVYRLCMHGITFSILYGIIQALFGFSIPFGPTAVLIIWMVLVFRDMPAMPKKNRG